jgi:eukaryotic translation initiation factor 2C
MRDKNNPSAAPRTISVYDYFVKTYNIRLEYWFLPLVKTDKDGTFPMEVCTLLPNQVYRFKTDSFQVCYLFMITSMPC